MSFQISLEASQILALLRVLGGEVLLQELIGLRSMLLDLARSLETTNETADAVEESQQEVVVPLVRRRNGEQFEVARHFHCQ